MTRFASQAGRFVQLTWAMGRKKLLAFLRANRLKISCNDDKSF